MTTSPIDSTIVSEDDPFLSTATVARMFDVKPETVRDWIENGKLAGTKINRSWRVRKSEVKRFSEQRYA